MKTRRSILKLLPAAFGAALITPALSKNQQINDGIFWIDSEHPNMFPHDLTPVMKKEHERFYFAQVCFSVNGVNQYYGELIDGTANGFFPSDTLDVLLAHVCYVRKEFDPNAEIQFILLDARLRDKISGLSRADQYMSRHKNKNACDVLNVYSSLGVISGV